MPGRRPRRRSAAATYDLVILDEVTYAVKYGWVDVAEVVDVLRDRPPKHERGRDGSICAGRDRRHRRHRHRDDPGEARDGPGDQGAQGDRVLSRDRPALGVRVVAPRPRVVIAGTHSGVGKTTVATGLMAALRRRGVDVAPAKVGPDFIDPGYHSLATGRPGRNLDAWMCGSDAVAGLAARAGAGAELLVVEGVMGLFDGAADGTPSSTAEVARCSTLPVVLVVDASAMSSSVAAIVHGFATLDPSVRVAGVILNRVGVGRPRVDAA